MVHFYIIPLKFQSTPSVGRATGFETTMRDVAKFQSTPSVGRATCSHRLASPPQIISIHALRGEGDNCSRI